MIATLFSTLFALMFLSVPIALSISIASITVFTAFFPGMDMISMLAQSLVTSADNFSVMAIPFSCWSAHSWKKAALLSS